MKNRRYELGIMDLYSIAINETEIESTPAILVTLREAVDKDRLAFALREALAHFPLFCATLEYKDGYSLVAHEGELPIIDAPFVERPRYFGRNTGGYLYRLCVSEREIAFEWSRILTDEYGARDFLLAILSAYFGEPINAPDGNAIGVFLETLVDVGEKSSAASGGSKSADEKPKEKKNHARIKNARIPTRKNPHSATVHTLRAPVSELRAASGRNDASPESVIIPIFSNVLYRRVKENADIGITADVTLNCRESRGLDSMHNLTVSKILTYSGLFGKADVKRVMEIYEKMLSSAKDSVKEEAASRLEAIKPLVTLRPRILFDLASLVVSKAVKGQRNDFVFTNLGEIIIPDGVKNGISSLEMRIIPDSADTGISVLLLSGELIVTISENYLDEKIISDFVGISRMLGINFREEKSEAFTQSRLRLK